MKHVKLLAMLMSAIAFTACSNDNEKEFAVDKTIRLSANIQGQQTRATMANSPNILFLQKSMAIQNESSTFAPPEPAKPLHNA